MTTTEPTTTLPTIEFVRVGHDAYGKHDGAWWMLDEHGNPALRVGALVNPVAALVDALDALAVSRKFLDFVRDREAKAQVAREDAERETKRTYGIAKMRERRIGNLVSHLEFIAGGGCEQERHGLARCVATDDEDASAPCNPCIARIALSQPSPTPEAPADAR